MAITISLHPYNSIGFYLSLKICPFKLKKSVGVSGFSFFFPIMPTSKTLKKRHSEVNSQKYTSIFNDYTLKIVGMGGMISRSMSYSQQHPRHFFEIET